MNWTGVLSGPDSNRLKVIVIVGPTAVGKSAVAVEVAKELGGEIVALDSRQVYEGMTVGTAQPTELERQEIPHHLYGIMRPDHPISAGEYARTAEACIGEILGRGNQPVICGGSGLYYRALTQGLFEGSASDLAVRKRLQSELKEIGSAALLKRLRKIDPQYAKITHPNNHKRLLRAMEIYEMTGVSASEHFRRQERKSSPYHYFSAYLKVSAKVLETRIRNRIEKMLQDGWIDEVKRLRARRYTRDVHPMDSLGYGQIAAFLKNKIHYDEMLNRIHIETRQYAKKQLTWFDKEAVDLCLGETIVTGSDTRELAQMITLAYQKDLMETG
ncbi:MAG: tRNA (adenosine(37)-N6)-dimethylallyltransferase MiaA [Candidatus Neomarinimicrobiota bacterium]